MNDLSNTTPRRSLPWIAGGAGCLVLLCVGLLASSGAWFMLNRSAAPVAAEVAEMPEETEIQAPAAGVTEADEADSFVETQEEVQAEADLESAGEAVIEAQSPEMSPLVFALETTPEGEAAASDFSFEAGVTRLQAVFDYLHLRPGQIWTQVWYHNGAEISSTSQPWLEGANGRLVYPIEAGGEPLPPGQWALEFYLDGELLTAGSFVIEAPAGAAEAGAELSLDDLPKVYKLAYTRWNGSKHDLYVGDTTGVAEQFVLGRAAGPSWSPDGRYLFFYGEEGIDQQNINGKLIPLPGVLNGVVRLAANPLPASVAQAKLYQGHGWNDGSARWANVSPDGSMIAYDGDRGGGRRIYFLGTDANQQFRYEIIGEQADWSPDSQKIVYRSGRNNQSGLWISNRTDSGHLRITTGGNDSFPAWSPDGKTIAFSRDSGGNVDIYTVNVDGTNLKRLTEAAGHDTLPAYLPNGDLVFRSARGGSWGIWMMKGDGSDQQLIIPNAPVGPEWSFSRIGVLR